MVKHTVFVAQNSNVWRSHRASACGLMGSFYMLSAHMLHAGAGCHCLFACCPDTLECCCFHMLHFVAHNKLVLYKANTGGALLFR
jgi:hypothetical protein